MQQERWTSYQQLLARKYSKFQGNYTFPGTLNISLQATVGNLSNALAAFNINSTSAFGSIFIQNGSAHPHFFINGTTGRVGIGTTIPTHTLTVNGTANITGVSFFGGNISVQSNFITNLATPLVSTDAATKGYVDGLTGSGQNWNVTGNNLYPLSLNYFVGIGTTAPNYALEINNISKG